MSRRAPSIVTHITLLVSVTCTICTAQERIGRNDTAAAAILRAAPDVRDELNTELFQVLKRDLPQRNLGGVTYYFVEGDRRLNEDQLLIYAEELNQQYATWRMLQSVPAPVKDLMLRGRAQELVSETEQGKIVRWKAGVPLTYCVMRQSFGTDKGAEGRYTAVVQEFREALDAWDAVTGAEIPEFVYRSDLDGSSLSSVPDGVTFAVWSMDLPGTVIASAFFPNDPQQDWHVLVDPGQYFSDQLAFDRVGVLRHELGHVLGFRHEHPRSEAPLVCQTPEVFDDQVIPLGEYDPVSVMHYFCRGFNNPAQEVLNTERRKLRLTPIDEQGLRLVYPPAGASNGFEFMEFNPVRVSPSQLASSADASPVFGSAPSSALDESASSGTVEPWNEPQDSAAAINTPDLYAWQLFVALNWPADVAHRKSDPMRSFGENATTVWESWKFSSGAKDEVFLSDGSDPGPWLTEGSDEIRRSARDFERMPLQQSLGLPEDVHVEFDPSTSANSLNENHMNQAAYDFVREFELYNIDGQEKLFADAQATFQSAAANNRLVLSHEYKLHFPVGAKEIKAQWREIAIEDKPRYYWVEFEDADGTSLLYGLTAIHITTKDIPNWFWATFEHVDNPKRANAEGWQLPSIDAAAGPNGYPEGLGIEGTRWENYRLRGTQVDFVDSFGNPTILANSQIESGFQLSSSCITCHARAAIGPRIGDTQRANRLAIFRQLLPQDDNEFIPVGNVGNLPEELFVTQTFDSSITGDLRYLQLDFVWSMMRARRKADTPPPSNVGFAEHIRPLFRQKDIDSMRPVFDLSKFDDVREHADAILDRLEDGSMPCDVPWSQVNVQLFQNWITGGKKP